MHDLFRFILYCFWFIFLVFSLFAIQLHVCFIISLHCSPLLVLLFLVSRHVR